MAVHGIDVNPFAIAIARFRLTVAALSACGLDSLLEAPTFHIPIAVGDSLLHGPRFADVTGEFSQFTSDFDMGHLYDHELLEELLPLVNQQYHAVVGNPPYITPKDQALNAAYRSRFDSCYRQYALSVPFLERFVELALPAFASRLHRSNYVEFVYEARVRKANHREIFPEMVTYACH